VKKKATLVRAKTRRRSAKHKSKASANLPSAAELAILASVNGGEVDKAFRLYLSATEYLKTMAQLEITLRTGDLGARVTAFGKLWDAGEFTAEESVIWWRRLTANLKPYRKLYKDERDDGVKSAVKTVTGRPCKYPTARDYLKKAWLIEPSRYTPPDDETSAKKNTAVNPWDSWCDQHTITGFDKEKKAYRYLWIPGELLEAALRRICRGRGISTEIVESALRSAAAVEYAIEHPPLSDEKDELLKQWVQDFDAAASVGRTQDLLKLRESGTWPKERNIGWLKKARSERAQIYFGSCGFRQSQ